MSLISYIGKLWSYIQYCHEHLTEKSTSILRGVWCVLWTSISFPWLLQVLVKTCSVKMQTPGFDLWIVYIWWFDFSSTLLDFFYLIFIVSFAFISLRRNRIIFQGLCVCLYKVIHICYPLFLHLELLSHHFNVVAYPLRDNFCWHFCHKVEPSDLLFV